MPKKLYLNRQKNLFQNNFGAVASSNVSSIQTVVTETSTTPTVTKITLNSLQNAIRVWTGEQTVSEPFFLLYVSVNGGAVETLVCTRWQGIIINAAAGATIALGTDDGRTLKVSAMAAPLALPTVSGTTSNAAADEGIPGFWTPSSAHITLPTTNSAFKIESSGTEQIVYMSEYDGAAWSPITFVVVQASEDLNVQCTYRQIAIATEMATAVSITAPTGSTIGGSSAPMTFGIVATGITYNVTAGDEADFRAKIALAVAGDEIVLPAGTYTMTANITQASFTANVAASNVGGSGVIIRGATGVAADVVIVPNSNVSGFAFNHASGALFMHLKALTVNIAGVLASAKFQGGKFKLEDVRVTGASSTAGAANISMDSANAVIDFQALRCQADDSAEDCWDGNGNTADSAGRGSTVKLFKCTGFDSGTTADDQQVLTTHNGQRVEVYGGNFYDGRLNVVACDSNAASVVHLFFTTISDGAAGRRGQLTDITGFFINNDSSAADQVNINPGGYLIGCKITRDGLISSNSVIRFAASGDLPTNITVLGNRLTLNSGRGIFPSVGGGSYAFNIITGAAEGMRLANYVASGSVAASEFYNNTFKSCSIAMSYGDVNLPSILRNNACTTNTNSIAGVTAPIDATIDGDFNVLDLTLDADYTVGTDDITGVNAALEANDIPTNAGNCDSNGQGSIYIWSNGIDAYAFPLIYKAGTVPRGARSIPEIVSGAIIFPRFWV